MSNMLEELKFLATQEKGEVSALLMRPDDATHLLVLGHGASSNMRTPMLTTIAEHLAEQKIATFRYNFPYSEKGGGRNSQATCTETIRSAVKAARKAAPDLRILAGGHSFSGRMTSTAQSESPDRKRFRRDLLLVSAASGRSSGHKTSRSSFQCKNSDAFSKRHTRRSCGTRPFRTCC